MSHLLLPSNCHLLLLIVTCSCLCSCSSLPASTSAPALRYLLLPLLVCEDGERLEVRQEAS